MMVWKCGNIFYFRTVGDSVPIMSTPASGNPKRQVLPFSPVEASTNRFM